MATMREALAELVRLQNQYRPDPAPHEWTNAWSAAEQALADDEHAPDLHMTLLSGLWRWGLPCTNRAGQSLQQFINSVEEHMDLGRRGKLRAAAPPPGQAPDHVDAARFRWVLKRNPWVVAGIAYSVSEACAFENPVEALDAAMLATRGGS